MLKLLFSLFFAASAYAADSATAESAEAKPPAHASVSAPSSAPVVGFISDVHMNEKMLRKVLMYFYQQGVTHIVLGGDISSADSASIHEMYGLISPLSHVPKERIFIVPGNWELRRYPTIAEKRQEWARALSELGQYGTVLTEDLISFGYVEIDGYKIAASHGPLHPTDKDLLPRARNGREEAANELFLHKAREFSYVHEWPDHVDLSLEFVSHTHLAGVSDKDHYYPTLNSGAVAEQEGNPKTAAIFRPGAKAIDLINFDDEPYAYHRFNYIEVPRLAQRTPDGARISCRLALHQDHGIKY